MITECSFFRIKGNLTKIIPLFLKAIGVFLFLAGYVIQSLPVRGEDWGVLRPFLRLNQGVCQNLVGSRVIDEDIRREVEDLNTLFGYRWKPCRVWLVEKAQ